jgi:predicted HicB family RNase H-like nuclease
MMDATPQAIEAQAVPRQPQERREEVFRVATQLFHQKPDWVTFFREVLGLGGVARRLFPSPEQMAELERSDEYQEIQQMLARLRTQSAPQPDDSTEPTRVITVRLPKSLHESLRTEAHERRTSMNKLCISKLLQMVDNQLVPVE